MNLRRWLNQKCKYLTLRRLRKQWVAEWVYLSDAGELVVEKLCPPTTKLRAQEAFQIAAWEITNAP
jgi:hypothetical protein